MSSMGEVIALEREIMAALPGADAAAGMMERASRLSAAVTRAHDILCNAWDGPGERLESLRTIAAELRRFA